MSARPPTPLVHALITVSTMAATTMSALDSTIANVALPHMQGSLSASREEISWVLTSYIVAAAILTPLTGWLAGRFGRRRLMLISVIGFTLASGLCGLATGLGELVAFRVLQGVLGAALVPMSQAILLDINPPEKHGSAMALWGMGAILGPIIGPALGGWLTDNFSWRWVFYVNVPIGAITLLGLLFLSETREREPARLDLFGFAMLALALGAFQLMLDRGQQLDWFGSTEIGIEAAIAAVCAYFFIVQMLTVEKPFVRLSIFADRNFVFGSLISFFLGVFVYGVLALLPPMLEQLMGYPVVLTGFVTAPRGLGTMVSMLLVGRLINRVDSRLLIFAGMLLVTWAMHRMTNISLAMDSHIVVTSGLIQGLGTGLIFVPLSTMVFATLDSRYRNEGAAMFTLTRNMGSAVGISVLQTLTIRNAATVHARLVEGVRPDNPLMALRLPDFDFTIPAAVARLDQDIFRQAMMVSYDDAFRALFIVGLAVSPLILLMQPSRAVTGRKPAIELE